MQFNTNEMNEQLKQSLPIGINDQGESKPPGTQNKKPKRKAAGLGIKDAAKATPL